MNRQPTDYEAIEAALLANTPLRTVAGQYKVSKSALSRHQEHLPAYLVKAQQATEVAEADSLLTQLEWLQARALAILDKAEAAGELKTALAAIREVRATLELLAKLLGELQQEGTVNIYLSPEWHRLRGLIICALEPYPEARLAVVRALGGT